MKKTFTFRVDDILWEKFHIISESNKRSANNQLECLVEEFIRSFEKENGEILLGSEQ